RRPHPQGRKARRSAGGAADEIRLRHQSEDSQGARPRRCPGARRPSRRRYRMKAPPQASTGGELMSNALLAEYVGCGWITPAPDPSWAPGPKVHVAPFDEVMRELRADRDRR